jgi:Flp pilus assembly protein TadD
VACLFVPLATALAQAPAGNEKFDQKQYAEAANAYERIPAAQRDAGIYNRLGVSYHMTNQLRAAENAYKGALRLQSDNADAANNMAALYYSQKKFSDAERQVRRALRRVRTMQFSA